MHGQSMDSDDMMFRGAGTYRYKGRRAHQTRRLDCPAETCVSCLEFPLRLSRACLGTMIVFSINWQRERYAFFSDYMYLRAAFKQRQVLRRAYRDLP